MIVLLVSALALAAAHGNAAPTPKWHDNYRAALAAGAAENKPLAVVVGAGSEGWQALCTAGRLNSEACRLLERHYVCLYVDRQTEAGRKLAADFGNPADTLLVLSDRTREYKAFKHQGAMNAEQLVTTLRNHTNTIVVTPQASAPTYVQPASYQAPVYFPAYGGVSRGCPNCR